nr:hypothetical protein [uncultured Methylobacterium sp.]
MLVHEGEAAADQEEVVQLRDHRHAVGPGDRRQAQRQAEEVVDVDEVDAPLDQDALDQRLDFRAGEQPLRRRDRQRLRGLALVEAQDPGVLLEGGVEEQDLEPVEAGIERVRELFLVELDPAALAPPGPVVGDEEEAGLPRAGKGARVLRRRRGRRGLAFPHRPQDDVDPVVVEVPGQGAGTGALRHGDPALRIGQQGGERLHGVLLGAGPDLAVRRVIGEGLGVGADDELRAAGQRYLEQPRRRRRARGRLAGAGGEDPRQGQHHPAGMGEPGEIRVAAAPVDDEVVAHQHRRGQVGVRRQRDLRLEVARQAGEDPVERRHPVRPGRADEQEIVAVGRVVPQDGQVLEQGRGRQGQVAGACPVAGQRAAVVGEDEVEAAGEPGVGGGEIGVLGRPQRAGAGERAEAAQQGVMAARPAEGEDEVEPRVLRQRHRVGVGRPHHPGDGGVARQGVGDRERDVGVAGARLGVEEQHREGRAGGPGGGHGSVRHAAIAARMVSARWR